MDSVDSLILNNTLCGLLVAFVNFYTLLFLKSSGDMVLVRLHVDLISISANQTTLKPTFRGGMSRLIGSRKMSLCAIKYIWFCFCKNKLFNTLQYIKSICPSTKLLPTDINIFCTATKDCKTDQG